MSLDARNAVILITALHAASGQRKVALLEGLNTKVAVYHRGPGR